MSSQEHLTFPSPQEQDLFSVPEYYYLTHSQTFPTSSTRDDCTHVVPLPTPKRIDGPPAPFPTPPSSLQTKRNLQQGVWLYGSNVVYTADHPTLRAYIMEAQATLHLPAKLPEPLMALAALELFYHPESPVHWLFWSDERKRETAELVNRICLHKPQLIDCKKTSWNGIAEYLSVLSQVHGSGYRHRYEGESWYTILVPPKVKSPARMPNLRKRKPAQLAALCEPQELDIGDDVADVLEPSRKRPKTKRTASERAAAQIAHLNEASAQYIDSPVIEENTLSATTPTPDTPQSELSALPDSLADDQTPPPPASLRVSNRTKKPKRTPDATPPPLLPSSSTSSSPATSELATPHSLPATGVRVRSTSHSSAETLIGGSRNRSIDRSSVDTVVQLVSAQTGKGKGREMKQEIIDLAVAIEADPAESVSQSVDENSLRTRSRSSRASSALTETASKNLAEELHEECDVNAKTTTKKRNTSTRKRKTKPRTRA